MMKQARGFSTQTIKEKALFLLDTYSGNECNISLHAENIIRNQENGEPVRFDNLGLSLCCSGEISSEVNLVSQTVKKGELEIFFPGTSYHYFSMSDDCSLIGMAFSPYYLKEGIREMPATPSPIGESHKVLLDKKEIKIFKDMARTYLETISIYGEDSQLAIQMALCIILFAKNAFEKQATQHTSKRTRADEICRDFVRLLNRTKGTERTIEFYANKLCVSNHYLSVAIKQASGQSVKNLIDKAVITEIKILLKHSDLSVSQISDKLHFPSSSFLCKYFKSKTGISPLKFRDGNPSAIKS